MRYEIKGDNMPAVICYLDSNETVISEAGAMAWMSPNMEMQTEGGGIGKVFGRMLSGERAFQNHYTARGGSGMIAFASGFPGSIRAFENKNNTPVICQKKAFLAASSGVELSVHFQKKLGSGFFGGEGFVMQKLSGQGIAFVEIDGAVVEYQLEKGQQMVIDTGYLAAMDASVSLEVQQVKGVKNVLFGGEGLFNTVVTGPGRILIQTMPVSSVAAMIASLIPSKN